MHAILCRIYVRQEQLQDYLNSVSIAATVVTAPFCLWKQIWFFELSCSVKPDWEQDYITSSVILWDFICLRHDR